MPSLNYAVTGRATWTPEGWRTSEEAVMFINVQPAPRQHTSSNTINQPLTGDVHLSLLRVMEVSLWDNSAGEAGLAGPRLESVILRARWGQLERCCLVAQQARLPAAAHGVRIQSVCIWVRVWLSCPERPEDSCQPRADQRKDQLPTKVLTGTPVLFWIYSFPKTKLMKYLTALLLNALNFLFN